MQTETVVRIRAGVEIDPYSGEPTGEDWSPDAVAELPIVTLAPAEPRPSSEPVQDARNAVTSGWTLYLPTADVTSRDRMRVRDVTYHILGEPSDWMGAGIVVQCSLTEG